MKRLLSGAALAFMAICALFAQTADRALPSWSLTVSPCATLPLLAGDLSSAPAFSTVWGGSLAAEYSPKSSFPLSLRLGAGYSMGGLTAVQGIEVPGSLGEALLFAGAGLGKDLGRGLSLRAFLDGGFAYGKLSTGTSAPYGAAQAGAGLDLMLNSSLSARLELFASYKAGLYGGLGASLGLGYRLPERDSSAIPAKLRLLELSAISVQSVFPVLRSYYDQNPIGSARITNTGKEAARDIRVSFFAKQYMDAPKDCASVAKLEPGASIDVPLYALFNDRILDVTEPTKASGEVAVEYGEGGSQSRAATLLVNDRNALTWSDDRKAAAFVSSRDPWVLDLTGNFMAAAKGLRNAEVPKGIQTAIAIHEGLRQYNIGYMLSTTRPFEQASLDPEAVDTLKFPRQTLSFRAGDCADLSVLYASCLEAAGVETAFVTIPGHIFIAIDAGLAPEEARARAMDEGELIAQAGRLWLPLETTMRDSGFLEIWKKGAEEWRLASAKGTAAFYPVHEAWKTYAPMGLPADGSSAPLPPSAKVASAFSSGLASVVDAELRQRLAALGKPATPADFNKRGVLYGRYGRLSEAEADFRSAAKAGSGPALVNLGNIAMLKADPAAAYEAYQTAAKKQGGSAALYLNLAKAAAALGKADESVSALESARKLDPKAAERYAAAIQSGSSGTRAAAVESDGLAWF